MKYLNRTLYRDDHQFWLRRDMKKTEKTQVAQNLKKHMKYFYDEELFYRTFKISRQEFLTKIENAKDP
jgi:hypothetical protein